MSDLFLHRTAKFPHDDEKSPYRYALGRYWGKIHPETNVPVSIALFIMLNPSTADAYQDDPTIRKCMGFAKSWRMDGCEIVNLFALRSPYPADLKKVKDPIGPENDWHIAEAARHADRIICAWGKHGEYLRRAERVLQLLKEVQAMRSMRPIEIECLRMNGDKSPQHPLYIPYTTVPIKLI